MYNLFNFNFAFIRGYVDSPIILDNNAHDDMALYCMGGEL